MIKKTAVETQEVAPEIVTEQPKEKGTYKLTYGNFESKKEALEQLTVIKKKVAYASLIIEENCYKIFFGEFDKATGDKALETVKAAGFEAVLY